MLQSDLATNASNGSLTISSSSPLAGPSVSSGWHVEASTNESVSFKMDRTPDLHSIFVVHSNSSKPSFSYHLVIDSTDYAGSIIPVDNSPSRWFARWTDDKEGALSSFIPEEWQADLQIIRPYNSMTGFVFFARGGGNTLAYVFYPFMPMHVLPSKQVCGWIQACEGLAASDKVRESSFGNAPLLIGKEKTPREYFDSELLPILRRNLDSFAIDSTEPVYALRYDEYNKAGSELIPGLQYDYHFDVQGNNVVGKSMLLLSNHTSGDLGYWTGYLVGVESSKGEFDEAFQDSTTTLLTLESNSSWIDKEQDVLLQNAEHVDRTLVGLSELLANQSISNFDSDIATAAHALVRSYNETRIGAFANDSDKREIHLPLFESTSYWYLDGDLLVGRKVGRNVLNSSTLEPLYR